MADNVEPSRQQRAVTVTDALEGVPAGTVLGVSPLDYGSIEATTSPQAVSNWESLEGTLLAVCIQYDDTYVIEGTAVMIGLGLALSAAHVFDDHRDALVRGEAVLRCFGMRASGMADIWHCYAMSRDEQDEADLELLCLRMISDLPVDRQFKVLPLTTRIPPPGETVTVMGYQFSDSFTRQTPGDPIELGGALYASRGSVGEFSYPMHHRILAPYPGIVFDGGTIGGMSGGAVIDVNNHVCAITTRGLQSNDDQPGYTRAIWWLTAVHWRTAATWPPGVYDQRARLWDMPTVSVVGREYVRLLQEPNFEIEGWE